MAAAGPTLSVVVPPVGPKSITGSVAPQGFLSARQTDLAMQLNEFGEPVNGGIYISSVTGSDSYSGNDWDTAKGTFVAAAAAVVGGPAYSYTLRPGWNFYIDSAHFEWPYVNNNYVVGIPGTRVLPSHVYSVTRDANLPPITRTSGAEVSFNTNGSSYGVVYEGNVNVYGVTFSNSPNQNGSCYIQLGSNGVGNAVQRYTDCHFEMQQNGASADIKIGGASSNSNAYEIYWDNCTIAWSSAATTNGIQVDQAKFVWHGGGILPATNANLTLFLTSNNARYQNIEVSGVDFSEMSSTFDLTADATTSPGKLVFRDIKLPSAWSGEPVAITGAGSPDHEVWMDNWSSDTSNWRTWRDNSICGTIRTHTFNYRVGGSSDGVTPISWAIFNRSTTGNDPMYTPERAQWNELVGSAKTVTVEIMHDSQGSGTGGRFTTDEVWLEVLSLDDTTAPLGSWVTNRHTNPLVPAGDQPDSTATWVDIVVTPIMQKLSVSITPQLKGHIIYRVGLNAPGKTCYVDPLATVT